ITISEIKLFLRFSLNNCTELYITILINRESNIITVTERREKEKNLLIIDTIFTDALTIDILTIDTVITDIEDIIERAELLRLINITEFNLIFLIIMKAAVIS
ncbi:hypothetical protein EMPG_10024, partial [Blastomyces silverae]